MAVERPAGGRPAGAEPATPRHPDRRGRGVSHADRPGRGRRPRSRRPLHPGRCRRGLSGLGRDQALLRRAAARAHHAPAGSSDHPDRPDHLRHGPGLRRRADPDPRPVLRDGADRLVPVRRAGHVDRAARRAGAAGQRAPSRLPEGSAGTAGPGGAGGHTDRDGVLRQGPARAVPAVSRRPAGRLPPGSARRGPGLADRRLRGHPADRPGPVDPADLHRLVSGPSEPAGPGVRRRAVRHQPGHRPGPGPAGAPAPPAGTSRATDPRRPRPSPGRQRGQDRVPGHDEPRDPHAAEQHAGLLATAGRTPGPAAGRAPPAQPDRQRRHRPADGGQRHPGLLAGRGRPGRAVVPADLGGGGAARRGRHHAPRSREQGPDSRGRGHRPGRRPARPGRPAPAPGAVEPAQQRREVHRGGPDPRLPDGRARRDRGPAEVRDRRHRCRHRHRAAESAVPTLQPGRQLGQPGLWRRGPGPGDQQGPGRADGRQDRGRHRDRPRLGLLAGGVRAPGRGL